MEIDILGARITVKIDPKEFCQTVIEKVLYWLSANYKINYTSNEASVNIDFIPYSELEDMEFHRKTIQNTFLDFKLRHTVDEKTKTIRELIVAKAFYPIEK